MDITKRRNSNEGKLKQNERTNEWIKNKWTEKDNSKAKVKGSIGGKKKKQYRTGENEEEEENQPDW